MRAVGIVTVEQLQAVPDSGLNMTVTRALRDRASQWLQGSSATEQQLRRDLEASQQELKDARMRISQLEQAASENSQEENDDYDKRVRDGEIPGRKRRGRPRKVAA